MNKKKTFGTSHHDLFTGEPIDINELVLKLAQKLADPASVGGSKKKMSYSISPLAQVLIKKVAQETGATQGSIVEAAPLLFAKMAMDSLERRSTALGTLKTLKEQISRSLSSFTTLAPHLKPYTDQVETIMEEIMDMEKEAVASKNLQGVSIGNHPSLNGLKIGKGGAPPYNKEIRDFLGENEQLGPLFQQYQEQASSEIPEKRH